MRTLEAVSQVLLFQSNRFEAKSFEHPLFLPHHPGAKRTLSRWKSHGRALNEPKVTCSKKRGHRHQTTPSWQFGVGSSDTPTSIAAFRGSPHGHFFSLLDRFDEVWSHLISLTWQNLNVHVNCCKNPDSSWCTSWFSVGDFNSRYKQERQREWWWWRWWWWLLFFPTGWRLWRKNCRDRDDFDDLWMGDPLFYAAWLTDNGHLSSWFRRSLNDARSSFHLFHAAIDVGKSITFFHMFADLSQN